MDAPFHPFGENILVIEGFRYADVPHVFGYPHKLAEDMIWAVSPDECIDLFLCTPAVKISYLQGFSGDECQEDVPQDNRPGESDHMDVTAEFA
jgi:hypothetical protein